MVSIRSWTDISWDPNAPDVVAWRDRRLQETRQVPVPSRERYLASLACDRTVLDIGVVEHHVSNESSGRWLHRHLVEAAASCTGVDILADGVRALRERGYDVVLHDVTEAPLDDRFELIVAGELIEHVGAPQRLFDSVARMLESDGRFVLSTPNPYMLHRVWKHLRGRFPDSVDHVTLFEPSNLCELGARAGLELVGWRGVALKDLPGLRNRVASSVRNVLARTVFNSDIACDSIIYEFRPVGPEPA